MSISKIINLLDDTIHYLRNDSNTIHSHKLKGEIKQDEKYNEDLLWPSNKVRQTFINYFKNNNQHKYIKSSSVVPKDDPTLKFTNAGMNQFKLIFLGTITNDIPRVCNSQKCIRAGGKHNDLKDVGNDTYHHTFFEMLGNWSFNDYFKKESISMAWDLLTNVYGLDKNRIYVTYFEGHDELELPSDEQSKQIWSEYLPSSRILPFGMKDNFWGMGKTGPCGPCTEIHYDRLDTGRDASKLVNMDDPTVIEIWNIVFIQYNRIDHKSLQKLTDKKKYVDTGMGFERITSILQNKSSNYDTDIFMPIMREIQRMTGCEVGYKGLVGDEDVTGYDMGYRVIADHIRTLTIGIGDGVEFGNKDRNYVMRKICRRGVRYFQKLGGEKGKFKDLVDIVVELLGDIYPEIKERKDDIKLKIGEEENKFNRTKDRGKRKFDQLVRKLRKEGNDVIDGSDACDLYTTYGYPLDLTILMAKEEGMSVDLEECKRIMGDKIDMDL